MSSSVQFSALNTKIAARYGNGISNIDYINLINSKTLQEAKNYISSLYNFQESTEELSIYELEILLRRTQYNSLLELRNYMYGHYKNFFDALILNFNISDIKKILRALQRREDIYALENRIITFSIDKFNLSPTDTISTFVQKLEGTIYYNSLQSYVNQEDETILFYKEMSLDKLYYQNLIDKSKELSNDDRKNIKKLLGKEIDLLNILWIYRGIKYYDLIPEELFNFSIMGGDKLNYEFIRELCYKDSVSEFEETILNSPYNFIMNREDGDINVDELESARFLYEKAIKYISSNSRDIKKLLGYYYLLKYELQDLIVLLESKRFGLTNEGTVNHLVKNIKGSEITWP